MIRLYFLQALYHLRENPIITWVSVLGTAMAICMIMVLVITFQVRLVDCEPEVNRSRTLHVPYMSVKQKGKSDNESANSSMSVRTGRECFRTLTTPEAVTLVSGVDKVRASVPAGSKATADMVQTDCDAGLPHAVLSASIARQLFGTTDVVGHTIQLNYVDYTVTGVVADVSACYGCLCANMGTLYCR